MVLKEVWKTVTVSESIGCSFKFSVKVGVEESIVNALRITEWCVHNRLFNANFDRKFK
jgi:hypothetical protein